MKKENLLTGDRPTGKLHIGHYIGSLKKRVEIQDQFNNFIMIADQQALTDNAKNPKMIQNNLIEVILDYLSVGIDPIKSNIFVQSQIPELSELTIHYLNLVSISRLKRNPTVKNEMKEKILVIVFQQDSLFIQLVKQPTSLLSKHPLSL